MNIHNSWDARLGDELERLRIHYNQPEGLHHQINTTLQQYGFALVSGLGHHESIAVTTQRLLELSEQLGTVLPQSPRNETVEDIRDFSDTGEKDERGYRSGGELSLHSDPPTLIVLHCLQPAKSGGETYLVNVKKIHDVIGAEAPELLDVLYQGFPHVEIDGHSGEMRPAEEQRPIFMCRDQLVSCVHYRPFTEKAALDSGRPLSQQQIDALDIFDKYANHQDFALRFYLQPGETIILHNRVVLHARTDYEDWPEPDKRRHLLRVWIDAPDLLPIPPEHALGNIFEGNNR